MPVEKTKSSDYQTLSSPIKNGDSKSGEQSTLSPLGVEPRTSSETAADSFFARESSENLTVHETADLPDKTEILEPKKLSYAETRKIQKEERRLEKDFKLLTNDRWLARNGHTTTFIGLYLFSVLVLFRPYEIIPGLGFLSATAFYFALGTLLVYVPTQFATEGNLTVMSTEVKALLALALLSLITMPLAKSPATAWETFNDPFVKVVAMFIVMVNVLRTRGRLLSLMWLSLGIGIYLSYTAWDLYMRGELNAEGYRVSVEIGGMYGNPNDMALHLVMMIPLAICLGIAAKNNFLRLLYFSMALLFIAGNFVTYSRGGFLGLIVSVIVLAWKLGRRHRLNVALGTIFFGGAALLIAPGNYGLRMLSIFIPGLDPVGSSDQRKELLERSILVTLRNPWGIGIGNFPIVGVRNLQSHNAFTQVSSELGLLGLAAYLIFMISPYRKLGAIERSLFKQNDLGWFYYLSIGLQASIIAYMVSTFFNSVAYNWYIYYLIAYAVAFRRIYQMENGLHEEVQAESIKEKFLRFRAA